MTLSQNIIILELVFNKYDYVAYYLEYYIFYLNLLISCMMFNIFGPGWEFSVLKL